MHPQAARSRRAAPAPAGRAEDAGRELPIAGTRAPPRPSPPPPPRPLLWR